MVHAENETVEFNGKLNDIMSEVTLIIMDACDILVDKGVENRGKALEHIDESVRFAWLVNAGMDPDEAMNIASPEVAEMKRKQDEN